MKLWVVLEHDYDDAYIHGVFSTFEKAELYVDKWEKEIPTCNFKVNMSIDPFIVDELE